MNVPTMNTWARAGAVAVALGGLTLWGAGCVTSGRAPAPHAPVVETWTPEQLRAAPVVPGQGWGPFVLGAPPKKIQLSVGPHDPVTTNEPNRRAWHRLALGCDLDPVLGTVAAVDFIAGFPGRTPEGIGLASPEAAVTNAYGIPVSVRDDLGGRRYIYREAGLVVVVGRGRVTMLQVCLPTPEMSQFTPAAQRASKIIPGLGWGPVQVDATRNELQVALGDPSATRPDGRLEWAALGVACQVTPAGRVSQVVFEPAFVRETDQGIKMESSYLLVISAHGVPARILAAPGYEIYTYPDKGIDYWVQGGRVARIVVGRPLAEPVP